MAVAVVLVPRLRIVWSLSIWRRDVYPSLRPSVAELAQDTIGHSGRVAFSFYFSFRKECRFGHSSHSIYSDLCLRGSAHAHVSRAHVAYP